jgi:hypothetical protein
MRKSLNRKQAYQIKLDMVGGALIAFGELPGKNQ